MEDSAKRFFTATRYAVAGASSDPAKFGNKIFAWYLSQGITPTALNPKSGQITVNGQDFPARASCERLDDPTETSLSIVTPPAVTSVLLKEAQKVGIKAVWLQPGTFDEEILRFARDNFPGAAVGGDGGNGHEGWCVLVDGEHAMQLAEQQAMEKL